MKKNLYVVEGIAGVWHYHISETGGNMQPALCGESKVMLTELPLKAWGTKGHLNETYCKKCSELYEAALDHGRSRGSRGGPGYTMVSDTKHDMELPGSFPINNDWVRHG